MTANQKAIAIAAAMVVFTLMAVAAGKFVSLFSARGSNADGPSWETDGTCVALSLEDVEAGFAQIGMDRLLTCGAEERRAAQLHAALKDMAGARDDFSAIVRDWRPALETLFEKEPGVNPDASEVRVMALQRFLNKHPAGYYAQLATYMLALYYYEAGYAAETMKVLDNAGSMPAVEAYEAELFALAALRLEQYGAVGRMAGETLAAHPGSRAAYEMVLLSAEAVYRQGNSESALEMLRSAALDEDAPPVSRGRAYAAMARMYSLMGRPDMAARALVRIGADYPRTDLNLDFAALAAQYAGGALPASVSDEDRLALGRFLMDKEQITAAADVLGKGLPQSAGAQVLTLIGEASFRLGRYTDAVGYLEKARTRARNGDEASRACAFLGMALRKRNNTRRNDLNVAKKELESCAGKYSENRGLVYQALADLYDAMDSPVSAVNALDKMAQADPGLSEEHMHRLGRHYLLNGNSTAAYKVFDALVRNIPHGKFSDDAAFWAARIALRAGRTSEALERFHALRRDYPYSYFANRAPDYLRQLGAEPQPDWRNGAGAPPFPTVRSEAVRYGYAFMEMGYERMAGAEFGLALSRGGDEADAAGVGMARMLRSRGTMIPSVKAIELRVMHNPAFYTLVMNHPAYRELLYPTLYVDMVERAATAHNVPAALALAVIRQESRFESTATSRSNAKGLMQIIPSTGKWIADKRGISGFAVDQLYEVQRNVDFGNWYIREMLDKNGGDKHLAVAAYNGGPGNVRKWTSQHDTSDIDLFTEFIPRTETRDYVTKVMHNWYVYDYLLNN